MYFICMYKNLIIDVNNLWARAFHICKKETQRFPDLINKTIHFSMKMIFTLQKKYCDEGIVWFLADNPTSKLTMRKELSDGKYKSNRLKETDGYYRGIDYLIIVLNNYSEKFKSVRLKHLEADDLVPTILESTIGNSLLVSTDMDWARSIDRNTDWFNTKQIFNLENFESHWKFKPTVDSITLWKSLIGDTADNIDGIKGITETIALNIINNFSNVYDLLDCVKKKTEKSKLLSEFTKTTILKNERLLLVNHNCIYFCDVDKKEIESCIMHGSFNEKALSILYKSLDFPKGFDVRIQDEQISFGDIFSSFAQTDRK